VSLLFCLIESLSSLEMAMKERDVVLNDISNERKQSNFNARILVCNM